ncbi:MAG TPA: phosphoenolpyruvate carboxykinase (ATP), partial [Phycisphaerae bacterium]|nr:phosphoenolpyruvate carboxykinase (ATP) [Phycisphaerae bacterium]
NTRAILDAIHNGSLARVATKQDPVFGFDVPTECAGVPRDILTPRDTWADKTAYDAAAKKLAGLFRENFKTYEAGVSSEVRGAGPR